MKTIIQTLFGLLLCANAMLAIAMEIQVLGLFKDMAIIRVDGQKHKLRIGDVTPQGIKLIEANSEQAVLEIDNKREVYELGSHISSSFTSSNKKKPEARIWPTRDMYFVPGSINRQPVHFMVDTGATWVAMNSLEARKLGIDYRVNGERSSVSTANGVVPVFLVNLDQVKVGEIVLTNVQGAVLEGNSPPQILLGNSFLNRLEMVRYGKMMLLKKKW